MKTEPNPPNWEVLAGMVERVTSQNAENDFCVIRVKVRGHRELVTVPALSGAGRRVVLFGVCSERRLPMPPCAR
jgi:hypothetical protein